MSEARVRPATIRKQRVRGWRRFHPERYCHRCGNRNIYSWCVDSSLWKAAEGISDTILCPTCFTDDFERSTGQSVTWRLQIEGGRP